MKDSKGDYLRNLTPNELERSWKQIYERFIEPELAKRSATSPIDLSEVYRVLIKLPKEKEPIVEFNENVQFSYIIEGTENVPRSRGESLNYYEIKQIKKILPPKVDDRSVAFIYAWRTRDHIYFAFDFSPNYPDFDENAHELGTGISNRLHYEMIGHILFRYVKSAEDKLLEIGMSAFPALIPFPLNTIVNHLNEGRTNKALQAIEDHCDSDFIEGLTKNWYSVDTFRSRQDLFDDALQAHSCGLYSIVINALIGQIEGIITDWLYSLEDDGKKKPRGSKANFEKFKRIMGKVIPLESVEEFVLQSICKFLVSPKTILKSFSGWDIPDINANILHRHPIQHGKHIPKYYVKANSIKIFLMIDSIHWCIQRYESYKKHPHIHKE